MKQAGREQLWQQQAEEKQGTRSQNGEAGRKTKRRTGGGDGWERETKSGFDTEARSSRQGCSICIREGLNSYSATPFFDPCGKR